MRLQTLGGFDGIMATKELRNFSERVGLMLVVLALNVGRRSDKFLT